MSEEKLKLAEAQRFTALKNALNTVDQFAIPSVDPEMYHHFEKLKAYLTQVYKPKNDNP